MVTSGLLWTLIQSVTPYPVPLEVIGHWISSPKQTGLNFGVEYVVFATPEMASTPIWRSGYLKVWFALPILPNST